MTAPSHHRKATTASAPSGQAEQPGQAALADRPGGASLKGAAPHGIWWVAWRLQRAQILVLLAIAAVFVGVVAAFRLRVTTTWARLGCEFFPAANGGDLPDCTDATGTSVWWNDGFSIQSGFLHGAALLGPVVFGAFAAAPIFAREFAHGTHVLALTQSVSRTRWFIAKTTVVLVPLIVALLAVGIVMQWTDGVAAITAYGALESNNFLTRGIMPAALGLAAFAVTLAMGMIFRNLLPALVAGILVGLVMLFGLGAAQLHVLPPDRTVTTLAELYPVVTQATIDDEIAQTEDAAAPAPPDPNQAYVGQGYLNAAGGTVDVPNATVAACFTHGALAGEAAAKAAGLTEDSGAGPAVVISGGRAGDPTVYAGNGDYFNSPEYRTAYNESVRTCFEDAGAVAEYTDMIPGSMLWPLRWAITGICVVLAAVFLGISAWRLKAAVAKR